MGSLRSIERRSQHFHDWSGARGGRRRYSRKHRCSRPGRNRHPCGCRRSGAPGETGAHGSAGTGRKTTGSRGGCDLAVVACSIVCNGNHSDRQWWTMKTKDANSLVIHRDIAVRMRDGVHLFANLYRPSADGRYPLIMSVTPYGKDKLPDRVKNFFMRLSGIKFGNLHCSRLTGFESPDPVYWTEQGYALLQADIRGMHKSEGHAGFLRQQDAEDYH